MSNDDIKGVFDFGLLIAATLAVGVFYIRLAKPHQSRGDDAWSKVNQLSDPLPSTSGNTEFITRSSLREQSGKKQP